MKSAKVPVFSGDQKDFDTWERQWKQHLRLHAEKEGGVLRDAHVLHLLKQKLDKATAEWLEYEMLDNPELSYESVWEQVCARFSRDTQGTCRRNWEQVKLQIAGAVPTLQEWSRFTAHYVAKRSRVERWTEERDRELVLAQTPEELLRKVLKEEVRRAKKHHWVRIVVPDGLDNVDVMAHCDAVIGRELDIDEEDRSHLLVKCKSEEEQTSLTRWDGGSLGGYRLRVSRSEYCMSGDEVLAHVKEILTDEEHVTEVKEALPMKKTSAEDKRPRDRRKDDDWRNDRWSPRVDIRLAKQDDGDDWTEVQRGGQKGHKGKGGKGGQERGQSNPPPQRRSSPPRRGSFTGRGRGEERRAETPPPDVSRNGGIQFPWLSGECWYCAEQGRNNRHYWSRCRYRNEFFAKRDADRAAAGAQPRSTQGKGFGKGQQQTSGKGFGKGGGSGEGMSPRSAWGNNTRGREASVAQPSAEPLVTPSDVAQSSHQ